MRTCVLMEHEWLWWLGHISAGTKVCGRCGLMKPATEFVFKDKDQRVRHSWCRECFAEYKRAWYERNRDGHIAHVTRNREASTAANRRRAYQYLAEHPCVDCGETDPVVLEFDHVRGIKRHDVSTMIAGGFTWATIEEEIAKCDIRCGNDHKRRTAKQRGFYDRKRNGIAEDPGLWREQLSGIIGAWAVSSVDRAPTF